MKNSLLVLSGVLFILSFSACAPRDVDVASEQQRNQFGRKGDVNAAGETGFKLGNYSLAAHLVDRAAEAVQILRWTRDPEARAADRIVAAGSEDAAERRTLWSAESRKEDVTGFDVEEEKIVDSREALLTPSEGPFERWRMKVTAANRWRSRADGTLSLEASQRRHVIRVFEESTGDRVTVEVEGALVLSKGGKTETHPWTQKIEFLAVKTTDGYAIRDLKASMNVASLKRDYALQAASLAVAFDGCLRVGGDATVTSGRKPVTLSFAGDRVAVTAGGSWSTALPECAKRPVIDLYRIVAP